MIVERETTAAARETPDANGTIVAATAATTARSNGAPVPD